MAEIKKIGDEFFVEYYAQGLLFHKKGGKTLPEAEVVLKKIEDSLPDQHKWYRVREDKVDQVFQNFLQIIQNDFPDATYLRFKNLSEHFRKFLALIFPDYQLISHVTPHVVSRYSQYLIEELKGISDRQKVRHVNFSLLLLSEVFTQAISWGALNDNPVLHVKPFRRDLLSHPRQPPSLKNEKIRQLIANGVSFIRIMQLVGIKDIGCMSYFSRSSFEHFEKKIL